METRLLSAHAGLLKAADLLRRGELVAFPTETVYGLGADATNAEAVAKIYAAKGRPSGNPLIVHVPEVAAARECVTAFPPAAEKLAAAFWPGPLTLVLPRGPKIAASVSAGRPTVALRCPRHLVADALLRTANVPIAAPSANRSGFTSPTTAQHVYAELAGRIPLILDAGACAVGLESTVLDLTTTMPTVLRPGAVTWEMLESTIGPVRMFEGVVGLTEAAASPGLHQKHYAPRTPAYRFAAVEFTKVQEALTGERLSMPAIVLTHDPAIALAAPHETLMLPSDAAGYARTLYDSLRAADERGGGVILVLMPGERAGLWTAILDRLSRATVRFGE